MRRHSRHGRCGRLCRLVHRARCGRIPRGLDISAVHSPTRVTCTLRLLSSWSRPPTPSSSHSCTEHQSSRWSLGAGSLPPDWDMMGLRNARARTRSTRGLSNRISTTLSRTLPRGLSRSLSTRGGFSQRASPSAPKALAPRNRGVYPFPQRSGPVGLCLYVIGVGISARHRWDGRSYQQKIGRHASIKICFRAGTTG